MEKLQKIGECNRKSLRLFLTIIIVIMWIMIFVNATLTREYTSNRREKGTLLLKTLYDYKREYKSLLKLFSVTYTK